jgi:hypothetical protein
LTPFGADVMSKVAELNVSGFREFIMLLELGNGFREAIFRLLLLLFLLFVFVVRRPGENMIPFIEFGEL